MRCCLICYFFIIRLIRFELLNIVLIIFLFQVTGFLLIRVLIRFVQNIHQMGLYRIYTLFDRFLILVRVVRF